MEEEKDEKSVEKLSRGKLWLIIASVVIIVIGAGAYFSFANKSETGGAGSSLLSSVAPKSLNPNCKYNDPDLCKFMNNWKEVKYLTMNSTDTAAGGKATSSVFKMEGDANTQIILSENGKENYNAITLDKTTYTKDYADNKWWKYTPKESDDLYTSEDFNIDYDDQLDEVEDKTTYKKIGKEACNKLTCFKYQEIDPAATDYTQFIYFDDDDYQLRKTRTENKDGSVAEATYDYSKLSLSAPTPTKDGSPYEALNSSSSSTTTTIPSAPGATTVPSTSTDDSTSTLEPDSSSADINTDPTTSTSDIPTTSEDINYDLSE